MRTTFAVMMLLLASACGAKVVLEEDGASGGAGGGATTATTSVTQGATSVSSGSTTSSSSVDVAPACAAACEALSDCIFEPEECFPECTADVNPSCAALFSEYLTCVSTSMVGCRQEVSCDAQLDAWLACESWCTGDPTCTNKKEFAECFCTDSACGPSAEYQAQCHLAFVDAYDCHCFRDGQLLGECAEPSESCPLYATAGCCAAIFFAHGG